MSPSSPLEIESPVSVQITADGTAIDVAYPIVSVDTWNAVNKVPRARLVFFDGDMPESKFPISDAATFLPGAAIEVSAGYGDKRTSIFSGIVVRHSIEIPSAEGSRLVVELADSAIKMTVARNTAVSEKKKDSDVMSALIAAAGLQSDVAATNTEHEAIVQFDATDWDTLLTRAEMNGMIVITEAGKVSVKAPDTSGQPALEVSYGESLLSFRAEMDAVSQYSSGALKSVAWDSAQQKLIESATASADVAQPGNVATDTLAQVLGISSFQRVTAGAVQQADLTAWSSAELLRSKLAKNCGQVSFQGSALAKTGTMLSVKGVGDRFNGNVFVSGVHHSIKEGDWTTEVDFGLQAGWHAQQRPSAFAPAAGHLPPIRGLQTGVVKKIDQDPSGAYRVQVTLPLVQSSPNSVWARLANPYSSNAIGMTFYPEIGDEVIVGFMNEDPRFPIILGSVYSSKFAPPYPPDDKNKIKGLKTKSKIELTFDDEDKIVTLKTPGGHVLVMDDKQGSISITDSNKNSMVFGKEGITIDSASKIAITAKTDISITATGNLSLKATQNASCEGLQIDLKAQTTLSAQGQASAELKASGAVTVKGALVQIN
jgi:Rhs element Vgr protein